MILTIVYSAFILLGFAGLILAIALCDKIGD